MARNGIITVIYEELSFGKRFYFSYSFLFRKNGHTLIFKQQNGVLMLRHNLPNYLAMDTAIFQANNTLVLVIEVVVYSPMNSATVQKATIAKTFALAQRQPFLFSTMPQTIAECLVEHMKMKMIMNTMGIVERGKMRYSTITNATPISCQEI